MTANADWLDGNNEYLAASLAWLRLRLRRLAEPTTQPTSLAAAEPRAVARALPAASSSPSSSPPSPPAPAPMSVMRTWFGSAASPARASAGPIVAAPPPPVLPAGDEGPARAASLSDSDAASDLATNLATAASRRAATAEIDPPPGLLFVAERLGLSAFERDTLLLCAAAELDPAIEPLLAVVQGGPARAFPTFGLALRLFDEPTWDTLSPHRPLRYARLLEINQPGATPLTSAALRSDERIVNFLKGMNALDERVAALVTPIGDGLGGGAYDHGTAELAPSQQNVLAGILDRLGGGVGQSAAAPVQLLGVDSGSKLAIARELCGRVNRRLYRIALDALPTNKGDLETLIRLWQRESALLPVALYIDAENLDAAPADVASAFHALTAQDIGLAFVGLRDALGRAGAAEPSRGHAITVDKPTPAEQRDAWIAVLPGSGNGDDGHGDGVAKRLAGQFNLNIHDIRQAAALASRSDADGTPVGDCLWDACRDLTQPRLDALAQRLVPKANWNDLVLSDESATLLRQIAGQVRGRFRVYEDWGYSRRMTRGLGISALFTGESGVGKTMAAEVIANELRLHLYRIDLSAVVSKYIGETEKNLRRLFDAAEQGGAILFFDEADALFGKRSEIKDSHDRYANIEINYLLQRMEAFSGLAILATNMKGALDSAFVRRLRFIVNFQFPGLAERRQIWQKALPPEVPREGLDYDRLARFNLSGGNIHSVALNAAFLAAQRAAPVTAPLIMTAVRSELRKLDKPINEAEFR